MGRCRDRTFTGCWTCRRRRVKCDETKPVCRACQRLGSHCSGYGPKLIWVDHDGQMPSSSGRREMRCEVTWEGFPLLPSHVVDLLIESCDGDDATENSTNMSCLKEQWYSPFHTFTAVPATKPPNRPSSLESVQPGSASTPLPKQDLILRPLASLLPLPDISPKERELLHHYVSYIAELMVPYDHPRNVWKTEYPAVALSQSTANQRALYSAIMAQAAFNMAHLRGNEPKLLCSGSRYYEGALHQLQLQIGVQNGDFLRMLEPMMTLLFAEIYNGQSRTWRHHFQGAWTLLREYYLLEPWEDTDAVCVSVQSLNIIRIIGGTSKPRLALEYEDLRGESDPDPTDTIILSSVFQTPEFGFTIGASPDVLQCIAEISQYNWAKATQNRQGTRDELLLRVLQVLNKYETCAHRKRDEEHTLHDIGEPLLGADSCATQDRRLQTEAFVHATRIYLYTSLLQASPVSVKEDVTKTFGCISAYRLGGDGNFSLWPAFIAAVEAYTDEDTAMAREWLDRATSLGIAGRNAIRRVVEEVWRRRDEISASSGHDRGMVAIDWLDVLHEVDADVLLV